MADPPRYEPDPLNRKSISRCLELLEGDPVFGSQPEREQLGRVLEELVSTGRAIGAVVKRSDRSAREVVGFAVAAFISNEEADQLGKCEEPYFARRFVRRHAAGDSPFLSAEAIYEQNALDGVNFVGLQMYGGVEGSGQEIRRVLLGSFQNGVRGFNLRTWWKEVYSRSLAENFRLVFGCDVVQDFTPYLQKKQLPGEAFLLHVNSDTAEHGKVFEVLRRVTPRYRFTPDERLLIAYSVHSLEPYSGQVAALDWKPATVESVWDRIERKIGAVGNAGEELYEAVEADRSSTQKRGRQRVHRLVKALREVPEEYVPYGPSADFSILGLQLRNKKSASRLAVKPVLRSSQAPRNHADRING